MKLYSYTHNSESLLSDVLLLTLWWLPLHEKRTAMSWKITCKLLNCWDQMMAPQIDSDLWVSNGLPRSTHGWQEKALMIDVSCPNLNALCQYQLLITLPGRKKVKVQQFLKHTPLSREKDMTSVEHLEVQRLLCNWSQKQVLAESVPSSPVKAFQASPNLERCKKELVLRHSSAAILCLRIAYCLSVQAELNVSIKLHLRHCAWAICKRW